MASHIYICPVGPVDEAILVHVAERVTTLSGIACKISSGTENPEYAYDRTRDQYNGKLILKHLSEAYRPDTLGIMGITNIDMYVPILKYVYGLAQLEGRCAVISLQRLRPQFYDQQPDRSLLLTRAEKTASHELGHSFGLTHCRNRRCVMYPSTRIEDTDRKQQDFCPTCLALFQWYLEKDPDTPH